MSLLIRVAIAAAVAFIVYLVATTLIAFAHSALIIGLVCFVIFLALAFGPWGGVGTRRGTGPLA